MLFITEGTLDYLITIVGQYTCIVKSVRYECSTDVNIKLDPTSVLIYVWAKLVLVQV